jgi:hypothetical protein
LLADEKANEEARAEEREEAGAPVKSETALLLVQVTRLLQVGLTDAILFFVVWSLARAHVLEGQATVALLSSYAGARFGMQLGRAQERKSSGRSEPPGGSGISGEIPSVRIPPQTSTRRFDPRVDEPWKKRTALTPFAFVSSIGGQ